MVALELGFGGDEAVSAVLGGLLGQRARKLWPDDRVEMLTPFVPGRELLILEITAAGGLAELEQRVQRDWPAMVRAVTEDELSPVKRRAAAASTADMSGVAGHARRCAGVAAGASRWHQPAEFELEILTLESGRINEALESFADWASLETTGAGVLPIDQLGRR